MGLFTFTVLGAMAEHFQGLSRHLARVFAGKVFVCERVSFWAGGGILADTIVPRVEAVPGVRMVVPTLITRFRERQIISVGLPEVVVGAPVERMAELVGWAPLAAGRWPTARDLPLAVAGADFSHDRKLRVGDLVEVRGRRYPLAGILKPTGGMEDRQLLLPIAAAQEALGREHLLTSLVVFPVPGVDPESLGTRIGEHVPGIETLTPAAFKKELDAFVRKWNALIILCGLLAAATGAGSITVVLWLAVHNQEHEIGLKMALGASREDIMAEYMAEALTLALGGASLGLLAGWLFIRGYGGWLAGEGVALFSFTGRLVLGALAMALLMGAAAGLPPAWRAASMDPARTLGRS